MVGSTWQDLLEDQERALLLGKRILRQAGTEEPMLLMSALTSSHNILAFQMHWIVVLFDLNRLLMPVTTTLAIIKSLEQLINTPFLYFSSPFQLFPVLHSRDSMYFASLRTLDKSDRI